MGKPCLGPMRSDNKNMTKSGALSHALPPGYYAGKKNMKLDGMKAQEGITCIYGY